MFYQMNSIISLVLLYFFSGSIDCITLEHSLKIDQRSYADCLFSMEQGSVRSYYCLRIENYMIMTSFNGPCYAGNPVTFQALKEGNVTTSTLLAWPVPIDIVDAYGAYLQVGQSQVMYICNCTDKTFGRFCEYSSDSQTVDQIVE
jgi:hypothetical protein